MGRDVAGKGNWNPERKRGKKRQAHFMDVALDGYVRFVALELWRTFEDLSEAYEHDAERAMTELGSFAGAGAYQALWQQAWREHVWPVPQPPAVPLLGRIEAGVRQAVAAERAARLERQDVLLEDTPPYKAFVARAMDSLLEASAGEREEIV